MGACKGEPAITAKLFEGEMVALSEWAYQVRYLEEVIDTVVNPVAIESPLS